MRDALRERVDCSLPEVARKEDGAWVSVGGIVSESKRVRTRNGAYVMFATLDDLEGRVELFVRDAGSEAASRIELDRVVLVRGRVDHKGRGETSLVVAEAEPFEPGEDEVAAARAKAKARRPDRILLRVSAAEFGAQLVEELKSVFQSFPGDCEVMLEMETREGTRRLRFGHEYSVTPSQALRAELDHLLGPQAVADPSPANGGLTPGLDFPHAAQATEGEGVRAGECRQCRTFCDRLVDPRGCVELRCRYLYSYVDSLSGGHYMGCMRKVFRAEIDLSMFEAAEQNGGYGGIKMTGEPLPQCQFRVEPAYEQVGPAHECVNPGFFDCGDGEPRAFDLRDALA